MDALLDTSHELLTKSDPNDRDEQPAHDSYQFDNKEVTVEEKHSHVQQWLDGMGMETTGLSTCETKSNQQFSWLVPLLQLLFAKGVLDEIRPHLPAPLKTEVDKLYHQSLTTQENVDDTCDVKNAPCSHVNERHDSMKESKGNASNIINPTHDYQTNEEVIIPEKELMSGLNNAETKQRHQNCNFNDNKSMFMDGSTNIMHDESRPADKNKIIEKDSLLQCCIDSPLLPKERQMVSEKDKQIEKHATKLNSVAHSSKPDPIGLSEEANGGFVHVPHLVRVSSRNIHHATPRFHQGPKKLLNPITSCLGCSPHPDRIILTSRNYLCSLHSDKHTCPFHRRLVDKHFKSAHLQKNHHRVETSLRPDKIDLLTDDENTQSLCQALSSHNDQIKTDPGEEVSSLQTLQDITNASVLNVFDYHTPTKHEPRPTQLIMAKVSDALLVIVYKCMTNSPV